jgi:hypothetical protein
VHQYAGRVEERGGEVSKCTTHHHACDCRDIPLLLSALWDAKLWQESIADAHTLEPWNQTRDLTREAAKASRLAKQYERLHDRIYKANSAVCARSDRPAAQGEGEG